MCFRKQIFRPVEYRSLLIKIYVAILVLDLFFFFSIENVDHRMLNAYIKCNGSRFDIIKQKPNKKGFLQSKFGLESLLSWNHRRVPLYDTFPIDTIAIPKSNDTIPESAIVLMFCNEEFAADPEQFGIPYFILKCDPKTNNIDCHEAVPYLNFIYDHYDSLPAKRIIFAHGHVFGWHYSVNLYLIIKKLLRTKEFYEMDYGSLEHMTFQNLIPWKENQEYDNLFSLVYRNTSMMKHYNTSNMWYPCCGSFFVASKQFKIHPKQMYLDMIYRLRNYSLSSKEKDPAYYCGRILEYTWHTLFTDNPIVKDKNYTFIGTNHIWSYAVQSQIKKN